MIIGWGLANYWTCAPQELGRHRYRLAIGVLLSAGMVVWMGWQAPVRGLAALVLVLLCALAAFAGRARQLSSSRMDLPASASAGASYRDTVVLLVAKAHPPRYQGPGHWAACLRGTDKPVRADKGWFSRPFQLSRIRQSYVSLGRPLPTALAVEAIVKHGETAVPPFPVLWAHPWAEPTPEIGLLTASMDGATRVLVQPVDLDPSELPPLQARLDKARTAVARTEVVWAANIQAGIWTDHAARAELQGLVRGRVPSQELTADTGQLDKVMDGVRAALAASADSAAQVTGSVPSPESASLSG
ncbi:MAG: hypothetical protein ACOX2L_04050 [Anaerolineae bacterium]|nr:hypothetical protein [Chloroflexota bacterium]